MKDASVRLLSSESDYLPLTPGIRVARVIQATGLSQLAGGFANFDAEGEFTADPMTHDEVFFVHKGELEVVHDGGAFLVPAGNAAIVAKGSRVRLKGKAGTIAFYVERLD